MQLNYLISKFFLSTIAKFIASLGVILFNIIIIYFNNANSLGVISSALSLIVFLSIFTKFGLNLASLKLTSIFYEKKDLNLSEDDLKRKLNEIQKITDNNIEKIDKVLELKKTDILKV